MQLVLGLDVGTTAVKALLLGADLSIRAEADVPHELLSPRAGWAEEDPAAWWSGVSQATREVLARADADPAEIRGVGVSGMVPAIVLLDASGEVLRPSIQQNDARSAHEIEWLAEHLDPAEIFRRTRSRLNQQQVLPRYLWVRRHEPEVHARVRWILGSYDYIVYRLTGELSLEVNWAVESGLYDVEAGSFIEEWLDLAGIAPEWLPPVRQPVEVVGRVRPDAAAETGIPAGTPVVAGSADHVASALAAGVIRPGDLLLKFGGAGDILYATDRPTRIERLYFDLHDVPGLYLPNGCMTASGSLVKWFRQELARDLVGHREALLALDEEAAHVPPGSEGVVVLPYVLGEKTPIFDPLARGVIFGLALHHRRAHLFRAVLEAVAYGFRHHVEELEQAGLPVRRVLATDGGTRSRLWRQITADVLGRPLEAFPQHPGSALGAAFVAGMGVGLFADWAEVEKARGVSVPAEPVPEAVRTYETAYGLYRELYPRLAPLFPRLEALQR